ncbi:hypothetical protein [uncultured Campylobacter sp.]|uniref:hypothetical protein n=1 Tax=uncultured Campylobacter sp. TaxID=218934 RepID=UPI0026123ED6|nr:hypothetical protein [uncultured Campylobacter sp.]
MSHTENKILRRRLIQARRNAKIAIDTKYFASRRDDAKRNLRTRSKGICDEISKPALEPTTTFKFYKFMPK